MQLIFAPILTWTSIVLLAGGLLAEIVWSYRRTTPQAGRWPFVLRLASGLLLLMMLLRPSLEITETESTEAVLIVAADASPSMQTRDMPGAQSRRATLLKALTEGPNWDKLREKIVIKQFDYSTEIEAVESFTDRSIGNQTSIAHTLEQLLDETDDRRSVGMLFLGDGAQRAYPPLNGDPRAVALRFGEQRVPIWAVPFGATGFNEQTLDLAIEELLVDPVAFANTTVPVSIRLRAIGAAGKKVTVRLLLEDRAGRNPGNPGLMQPPPVSGNAQPVRQMTIESDNQLLPLDLSFVPQESGEFKLRVEVETLDREVKTVNNSRETILSVRKGGIRVALFHSLLPEQQFLRKVNRAEQIQIDFQPVMIGNRATKTEIPNSWFDPGRYDAYILGDIPADAFTPAQLKLLAERVRNDGAGLMMLGGLRSYGPGGYAGTPLEELLPVNVLANEKSTNGRIDPSAFHMRDLSIEPSERGRRHYLMQLDSESKNAAVWEKLPPLQMANRLTQKNLLVEILATAPDGTPLLFAHEVGRSRVLAFAGDSTWRWHLHGFQDQLLRFWQQVVLWLSRKELDSDQTVWVRVQPRNFGRGEKIPLEFGARNETGQPLDDVQFKVNVMGPDDVQHPVTPRQMTESFVGDFIDTTQPGDYWVRVDATRQGTAYGQSAWTRFLINAGDLELDNPAADPALMEELAKLSGGSVIQPEELPEFLDNLLSQGLKHLDNREIRSVSLWDNPWMLLAFISLLTLEWILRKKKGFV